MDKMTEFEKIVLRFIFLCCSFIFHVTDDLVIPNYASKIAPLQTWRWFCNEANNIMQMMRDLEDKK